ncbi:MAG: DUF308 domain-containing protein [Spirochaetales bacterium]|uniref:DUF308 domain-containing protein n=1 Tax=Candidatus Thalassospirochaeta sargassi TaxID=3119039 RepID=A0AAJ1IJU0_9SPIO|nr:DUF308 domain-containing protein [Spirochaetales bacterium]
MYFNDEIKPGMLGYLRNTAWAGFIYAGAAIVFGIFTVITPSGTLSVFISAIGFLMLVQGAVFTFAAIMGIKRDPHWYLGAGSGLIQVLFGLFIVLRAGNISNTVLMITTVGIGLVGIFAGTHNIINAIRYRELIRNVWPTALRGGLFFIIGMSMLLAPFGFGVAMMRVMGLLAVLIGFLQLWTSIRLIRELSDDKIEG